MLSLTQTLSVICFSEKETCAGMELQPNYWTVGASNGTVCGTTQELLCTLCQPGSVSEQIQRLSCSPMTSGRIESKQSKESKLLQTIYSEKVTAKGPTLSATFGCAIINTFSCQS